MKILHVYKNYYPVLGGIENYMRMLCADLSARGHEVTALVANDGRQTSHETFEGVRLIRAGSFATAARAPLSAALFWHIASLRPDIAHLHFPYPVGEFAHLLLGRAHRTVLTYHSDIVRQRSLLRLYEPFLWQILAKSDRIIATSPNYVKSSRYLSRFAERCVVLPVGVDDARFRDVDTDAVAAVRQRYGKPLVLFVGLFRYYKGLDYLIAAMDNVPATLVLVGSGPLDAELRATVRSRGLDGKVIFAGAVSDAELPAYFHACDVFVLPASHRSEALGMAQIEAMFCGKPVVCTELGTGTSYANRDGETGFVVPPCQPLALAEAINRLLGDDALRARMGHAAARRAQSEFSRQSMVDGVETLYRDLLSRRCPR